MSIFHSLTQWTDGQWGYFPMTILWCDFDGNKYSAKICGIFSWLGDFWGKMLVNFLAPWFAYGVI